MWKWDQRKRRDLRLWKCSGKYIVIDEIQSISPNFCNLLYKECDDPCCNATTCTLAAGAQCTRGECCTNECQFKSFGTVCRNASGLCDIEEYCSGQSSECPEDFYLQDSSPCNNNQSYCFSGMCKTYDDQCQYHFGSSEHKVLMNEWTDTAIYTSTLFFVHR